VSDMHEAGLITSPQHLRWIERTEANLDDKRRELGVKDELKDIHGVTTLLLVVFGEHGIKSIEDLAGCATDDLHGWKEFRRGRAIRHVGILSAFKVSRKGCEEMILSARIAAGWIKDPAVAQPA